MLNQTAGQCNMMIGIMSSYHTFISLTKFSYGFRFLKKVNRNIYPAHFSFGNRKNLVFECRLYIIPEQICKQMFKRHVIEITGHRQYRLINSVPCSSRSSELFAFHMADPVLPAGCHFVCRLPQVNGGYIVCSRSLMEMEAGRLSFRLSRVVAVLFVLATNASCLPSTIYVYKYNLSPGCK